MALTWGEAREQFSDVFRDSTTGFFGNSSGTSSEIYRTLRRVLSLIASNEAYTFQEREYSLTLTGAAEYDLDTLIPGWQKIKSITTNTTNNLTAYPIELQSVDIKDFQAMFDTYAYTIFQSRYLRLYNPAGTLSAGTLKIIYYTGYLIKDAVTGAAKPLPTSDSDLFMIPDRFVDVVTEGLAMLAFRKDRSNKEDFRDAKTAFDQRLNDLRENHTVIVETPARRMTASF